MKNSFQVLGLALVAVGCIGRQQALNILSLVGVLVDLLVDFVSLLGAFVNLLGTTHYAASVANGFARMPATHVGWENAMEKRDVQGHWCQLAEGREVAGLRILTSCSSTPWASLSLLRQ